MKAAVMRAQDVKVARASSIPGIFGLHYLQLKDIITLSRHTAY